MRWTRTARFAHARGLGLGPHEWTPARGPCVSGHPYPHATLVERAELDEMVAQALKRTAPRS